MCVHLLFSNRGDKSISDFLDLFSAVEKRENGQLFKKEKKRSSIFFSCQGMISSLKKKLDLLITEKYL